MTDKERIDQLYKACRALLQAIEAHDKRVTELTKRVDETEIRIRTMEQWIEVKERV